MEPMAGEAVNVEDPPQDDLQLPVGTEHVWWDLDYKYNENQMLGDAFPIFHESLIFGIAKKGSICLFPNT